MTRLPMQTSKKMQCCQSHLCIHNGPSGNNYSNMHEQPQTRYSMLMVTHGHPYGNVLAWPHLGNTSSKNAIFIFINQLACVINIANSQGSKCFHCVYVDKLATLANQLHMVVSAIYTEIFFNDNAQAFINQIRLEFWFINTSNHCILDVCICPLIQGLSFLTCFRFSCLPKALNCEFCCSCVSCCVVADGNQL